MASVLSVRVKEEPNDVFCIETDSEADEIDVDKLQMLEPKFASQSKFPVGCKVWYNLRYSPESNHLQAMVASVVGVYLHVENGKRVYRVKSETQTEDQSVLYENQLVYAINSPVWFKKIDTNVTVDGIIVNLERVKDSDGKRIVTYVVKFSEGNYVNIAPGVDAYRIKYRGDCDINKCDNNDCGQREEKESCGERKVCVETEEKEGRNDIQRSDGIQSKLRWEPPSQLSQLKRSSKLEAYARPAKMVKIKAGIDKSMKFFQVRRPVGNGSENYGKNPNVGKLLPLSVNNAKLTELYGQKKIKKANEELAQAQAMKVDGAITETVVEVAKKATREEQLRLQRQAEAKHDNAEFVALQAEVVALKGGLQTASPSFRCRNKSPPRSQARYSAPSAASPGTKTRNKKDRSNRSRQKKEEAWRKIAPKPGEPHSKFVEGWSCIWCPYHQAWGAHLPEKCRKGLEQREAASNAHKVKHQASAALALLADLSQ